MFKDYDSWKRMRASPNFFPENWPHNGDCIEKAECYFDIYGKQVSAVSTGVSDTGVNNPA